MTGVLDTVYILAVLAVALAGIVFVLGTTAGKGAAAPGGRGGS